MCFKKIDFPLHKIDYYIVTVNIPPKNISPPPLPIIFSDPNLLVCKEVNAARALLGLIGEGGSDWRRFFL